MTDYVSSALFVYTDDTIHLIDQLQNNSSNTRITSVKFDALIQNPQNHLEGINHVVVAGALDVVKEILRFSMEYHFCLGIIPTDKQKDCKCSQGSLVKFT